MAGGTVAAAILSVLEHATLLPIICAFGEIFNTIGPSRTGTFRRSRSTLSLE